MYNDYKDLFEKEDLFEGEELFDTYRNKNTKEEYMAVIFNDMVRLYSLMDDSGESDVTVTKEELDSNYELL